MDPGVWARASSARSSAARLSVDGCLGGGRHFASCSALSWGARHEFHVRRWLSTGELRVATPGVCTRERRRIRDESELLTPDVRRLTPELDVGGAASVVGSRASRMAARSSGEALFLTSCSSLMAASTSTWEPDRTCPRESRELLVLLELRRPRKHDSEFERDVVFEFRCFDLARELVFEFERERTKDMRPRGSVGRSASRSLSGMGDETSMSLSLGVSIHSLMCWRVVALWSVLAGDSGWGESREKTGLGDFESWEVRGFVRRLEGAGEG